MAYNEKAILRDVNGKPIPQYWNPETQQYESYQRQRWNVKSDYGG